MPNTLTITCVNDRFATIKFSPLEHTPTALSKKYSWSGTWIKWHRWRHNTQILSMPATQRNRWWTFRAAIVILRDRLSPFATFALSLDISRLNIHNLCTKEKEMNKKKQSWRYALLRFVAEERIWNSHCLLTHSYLYFLTRVQQNTVLFPFKFTSWLTEALWSSVLFSQRNRLRRGNK